MLYICVCVCICVNIYIYRIFKDIIYNDTIISCDNVAQHGSLISHYIIQLYLYQYFSLLYN